jgi:hypothetical protein
MKYKVLSPLNHSGTIYPIGSIAELADGTFHPSLIGSVLELIPEPLPVQEDEETPDPTSQENQSQATETKKKTRKAEAD